MASNYTQQGGEELFIISYISHMTEPSRHTAAGTEQQASNPLDTTLDIPAVMAAIGVSSTTKTIFNLELSGK